MLERNMNKMASSIRPVVQLIFWIVWLIGVITHSTPLMVCVGVIPFVQIIFMLLTRMQRKHLKETAKCAIERETAYREDHAKYNLTIAYPGDNAVQAVSALSKIYELGLKEASNLVDFVPVWFTKHRISRAEAEYVKSKLEVTGAKVRIE